MRAFDVFELRMCQLLSKVHTCAVMFLLRMLCRAASALASVPSTALSVVSEARFCKVALVSFAAEKSKPAPKKATETKKRKAEPAGNTKKKAAAK